MTNPSDLFAGRVAVLATMHRKEQAIAPVLEGRLGMKVVVPSGLDTDAFGTFSGEIKRPSDQLTTARLKAAAALRHTGETLAIASEGSFGPHPQIPFLSCDRELVLLLDRQHQLEIVGQILSTDTNYRSQSIHSLEEALAFVKTLNFPSHGVVVKAMGDPGADYNPTRMAVIAQATEQLVQVVQQTCPACGCPGFSEVQRFPGLPCGDCGTPTLLTLSVRYRCQRCQFQQSRPVPDAPLTAAPSQCPYCNP